MAETYYARRSARDPEWHEAQLAAAGGRYRRCLEADAEGFRDASRESARRRRAKQAAIGLTFYELWLRVGGERHSRSSSADCRCA